MRYWNVFLFSLFLSSSVIYSISPNFANTTPSQSINAFHRVTASDTVNLTIFHINDLHGWLNPHEYGGTVYGGVATYMGYFKQDGYDPTEENSSFLLLSGGDQNTGPAIATLSKGEAVIDVMNAMGFDAAAIGNHEFDFGTNWLEKRQNLSTFPILSCNIYDVGTTDLANFTIPWVV